MECADGTLWSFTILKQNKVTIDTLIQWFIPFHLIEQYAQYLNSFYNSFTDNTTICNCTQNRIGMNCEYELVSRHLDIASVIKNQRSRNIESYETLTSFVDEMPCNAGASDLEWRQVCDGIINCQDATDEFNCHLLEFNKCDADEFQCRNGMCIPKEFLYNVAFDCMDLSDEQELSKSYTIFDFCSTESKIECDERLCRKDQFSCGDGQCIHWSALINHENGCKNSRDAAYLCETVDSLMSNRQASIGICKQTTPELLPLRNSSTCILSLRHLLNANQNKLSNKTREIALNNIVDRCPELIQYPEQAIISPVLKMFYNRSLLETFYGSQQNFNRQIPRKPHLYCLNGSMACNGIWMTLEKDYCVLHEDFQKLISFPYFPISYLFCQVAATQASLERLVNYSTNQSLFYSCRNISDHLALRRVNDGYSDCLYGDDEKNNDHTITGPFRYQCQTVSSPDQYVSFQQLGNGINDCVDGSDEISREVRWSLLKCDDDDGYACWIFQGNGIDEDRIKNVRLSYHRHCDSVWDTMDGRDETNCSQWICSDGTYQCNRTGQCIDQTYLCDGEFDCNDGEDELNCSWRTRQWTLEGICNKTNEHFCITSQYIQAPNFTRPCIPYVKAGDGQIDCVGGRDERNVFSCPDHLVLGDRFLCDNQTKCLNYTVLCNGIDDCLDRTDEFICFWNQNRCAIEQFSCEDRRGCKDSRCHPQKTCSDRSHWFWCPNSTAVGTIYRSSKYQRLLNYEESCYKHSTTQRTVNAPRVSFVLSDTKEAIQPVMYGFCHRGFYLNIDNGAKLLCFCPPSYYGDRCQYDSRRVTVRVRFDRRHRFDIPQIITVLVVLLYNDSQIVDHQSFVDYDQDFSATYNIYLLYPRPRSKGLYSVRFEAYHSSDLLAAWEYKISPFDFLPAFRVAKILRFPERILPWLCLQNLCENSGTCLMMNNGQHLCLCQRGWQGNYCERSLYDIKCAPHSVARDLHVCICPNGYLEPHCFVRNTICKQSHSCSTDEVCYPVSHQLPNRYWCICNASNCGTRNTMIVMHRQKSNQLPFLLQLLKISADYPRLKQQILIHPSTNFPISTIIKTRDVRNAQEAIPEIGLFFTFEPLVRSVDIILHLLYINCSNSPRNYTVDLDVQPQRCRSLKETELRSIKLLRIFCQESARDPCFLLQHYICYCSSQMIPKSECISYHQRHTACTHCYNQGYCVQGDLQNKSDFICICPKCVSGKLCQFSPSRFSLSLEFLIEKTQWDAYHFIGPTLFFVFSMVFNGLCMITFAQPKARRLERALAVILPTKFSLLRIPKSAGFLSILILIIIFSSNYPHINQYKLVSHPDDLYPWCIGEIKPSQQYLMQYMSLGHQISPFLVNLMASLAIIIGISRSKASSHHVSARSVLLKQARQRIDLLLGPIICFITQLPQLIILFLDICDYDSQT
ncbi:unnamed protein product, partial [Didymodactylos carnosus]